MILALYLAFQMPAFHLVWTDKGHVVVNNEDMTLSECKARAKQFKVIPKAKCVLEIGEREYT